MAASLVGGAFLSGFLNVVFERLASPEVANLIRGKKLDHKLLQRLETTLYAVEAVLNDAEHRQIKEPAVKKWLDDLKDAVYVADDLLDRVSTKAVTQKEVSNLFSRLFNLQDREMVKNLEDIVDRLESILKLKDSLGLKEIARESFSWRTPSTSLLEGSNIIGRNEDKEAIIKLLLDDMSDSTISVIPIVGMGGVGKTTLAQFVYNDDDLKQRFDPKAWVCVSEEFDILKVTKTIIKAIASSACNMEDLNSLQLELMENLARKKFLIVLDDVWTEDYVEWNKLLKPFQRGIRGSKILVTTRSEKVASLVQTVQAHHLNHLSDDDCWSVFANHACLSSKSSENTALEKIGKKIVKKCKGLPLAAQTLGGLVRTKRDIKDWDNILNSDIWELSENESKIIPALRISYHYLPPQLKRCFVYCSLYPKDYEFNKDELILLWMAEDLLQPVKKGKFFEEVGSEYFDDLASRSFFQRSSTEDKSSFVMHDLMHDLATSLGGEFYFRSEELGKETKIGIKARHLSFSRFSDPILENFEVFGSVKFLRTILPINFEDAPFNNEKAPCIILSKFKYLRVLSFRSFPNLDALPDSIGELIHLRYLDLSWTHIKTLPESLGNLYNLQTLKLCGCYELTMLPSGMQNLVNLSHLDFPAAALKEMPRGMGKLNHLQHLSGFIVGKHEENGIKELRELSNLHGLLWIQKLENVTNSSEALEARLRYKKRLNNLYLEWSSGDDFTDSQIEMDILGKLQPHQDLNCLSIKGYRGTRFPDWVGHSSYHNMTYLSLSGCENCWMLPSLGQLPSLKYLAIGDFNGLHTIDADFYKNGDSFSSSVTSFPSLEYLEFGRMPCWEEWRSFESDAFPQLKELIISECPRLRGDLPNHLPALEALRIESCEQLASSLPRAPAIRRINISGSNKVVFQEFPLSVEDLTIGGSQVVESITNTQPTCLQNLYIRGCSSATSFPGGCLPASLKVLHIENFRKLEFPKQHRHELLGSLSIESSCDSLTSLPLDTFPNLNNLEINSCENLESLSVSQSQDDAALQNLSNFEMEGCPNFVSFPREGLRAPSLTYFKVHKCNELKSLPPQINTLLPKLEYLQIGECPEIESFPEGGMPPNLRRMSIFNCEKLLSGLASMDMLTDLTIGGPCESVTSFPKEGLLPPSLTSLTLRGLSSLETLECKGLLHLTSLQRLTIDRCPKLGNMTGERLPASLIKLQISESPLLEERCQTEHPQIWPKISHIRGIYVKGRWIS